MREPQPTRLPWEVVLGFRVVSRHATEDEARKAAETINARRAPSSRKVSPMPDLRCVMWAKGAAVEPNPSTDEIERWLAREWIEWVEGDGYRLKSNVPTKESTP